MVEKNRVQDQRIDGVNNGPDFGAGRQKILIVDDKRENLIALRRVFQDLDVEIIEATSGNQALAATLEHHFAVAILDVMMPGMDGFEVARHLRADERARLIPIVFVTACYPDEHHMFSGYEAGGVDYIVKPIKPEILLGKVRIFLELDRARQTLQEHRDHLETLVAARTAELRRANEAQLREITERRRLEEQLRDSESKLRSIVDNIGLGVLLLSPEMRILELNHQMRRWFPGVLPEEPHLCYQALNDPAQDARCPNCPTHVTFQDGKVHEAVVRISRPDGPHSCRIISSPVLDAEGRISHAIEIIEDVTERVSLEEQLLQSQKLEAIGQLAGGVAHDFNNMLTVIIGYSEELLDRLQSTDPMREPIGEILMAGQRSAALTRQLLAFSRKQVLQAEVLDLNHVVRNLEKMLDRLIGEHIQLTTEVSEELAAVEADPHQVEQVIMNLAINARDAMPHGGRLTIQTGNVGLDALYAGERTDVTLKNFVLLTVSDTGSGMSEETKNKIFDPFFTTKENGSGLGLSTVYGIVKQLEGTIRVSSEVGKGTTFQIFLPRARMTPPAYGPAADAIAVHTGEVTILLVEDEPILRRLAQSMLSGLGYRATAVSSGAEALAAFEEKGMRPDLVITDVVMPGMSGRELLDRLRRIQPRLRALYISGYTDSMIARHGAVDSRTPLLQKPFTRRELAVKIAMLLKD